MLTKYLTVFFVSMVPLIELRGAIPIGVGLGLPLWQVYIISIIGNMLPVPFIFFLARRVLEWGADKPVIGVELSADPPHLGNASDMDAAARATATIFLAFFIFISS